LFIYVRKPTIRHKDGTPRVIHLRIPEKVAVVPIPNDLPLFGKSVVFQHIIHLCLCKAEVFGVIFIQYRDHLQIVKPCKNAFFRNAQASRHHSKLQVRVVFEYATKERTDETNHLVIEPGGTRPRIF